MKCFNYPVDAKTLLRKKHQIKRDILIENKEWVKKKIAVLGGSTTDEIIDQIELFLLHHGILPSFYQSEYGQFWQDAVWGNKSLDDFGPDVVYIHTNWRNIMLFPDIHNTKEEVDSLLEKTVRHFEIAWNALLSRYNCEIIQNNFDRPLFRLLGNSDVSDFRGKTNFISRLNQHVYRYAQNHSSFHVNDIDYLSACYGFDEWSNPLYWNLYKYSLCVSAIPSLAKSVADIIKSIYGKNRKALMLDLDNTLWGGVIGDDGVQHIQLGPEIPSGQIYSEFQSYLKELKNIGVLLTVNSKNDEENAIAGINHPDGSLTPKDFAVIKANWDNKDLNAASIAQELNIGSDSFVFIDDNPIEREIIRQSELKIEVPEMDNVENYIQILDHQGYFEVTSLSPSDLKRTEMYQANHQRTMLEKSMANYDDFLENLNMKAIIRSFEDFYIPRIAQLTNKSNQFNLTTLRCNEADITEMASSDHYMTLYGKLTDRFGDNGIVAVVSGEIVGKDLHIRLWLMSCRVLKRGMEDAMMDVLFARAKEADIQTIYGYYYPTAKNKMVEHFYAHMGFEKIAEDDKNATIWRQVVEAYTEKKPHIEINKER